MWFALFISTLALLIFVQIWWTKRARDFKRELALQKQLLADLEAKRFQVIGRKQAEQEALFNSMVEGVLLIGADGRIQMANRSVGNILGIFGDVRGKTILEAFRWHELSELAQRVEREGTLLGAELQIPGIENRHLNINATTVVDQDKNQQGTILVFHDVTRIKQLESTRQEFVANVSHELRTPLSLIKGYAETLLSGAKDNPEVATRFLQTIDKHADRLTFLIDDLLTISRLESGHIDLNLQPTLLPAVVQRVIDDLQTRASDKNMSVQLKMPDDLAVHADTQRLQQVLFNLIDNAIKYGNVDGHVIVEARTNEKNKVEVSVEDDGPGIPAEAVDRIFERFYRVDKARNREQGGTGLGLSIVKHIVHCHGGEVWVRSEMGQGSRFCFTLTGELSAETGPRKNAGMIGSLQRRDS